MTSHCLYLLSGYPKSPLANGIGRYVCQLQRITIKFCKSHGSSRGMRDFIETELLNFAKNNPGIVVYVKPRRHKTPTITAEYLSGEQKFLGCRNFSKDEIIKWVNAMKTQSSLNSVRLLQHWTTQQPSIQGPWTPTTHRDPTLNVEEFPSKKLSKPFNLQPTATEQLLELFKEQQSKPH